MRRKDKVEDPSMASELLGEHFFILMPSPHRITYQMTLAAVLKIDKY